MILSSEQLEELSALAIKAALAAGEKMESFARDKLVVHKKEGGESLATQVVTEVDFLSEKTILEILRTSLSSFDLGLLT